MSTTSSKPKKSPEMNTPSPTLEEQRTALIDEFNRLITDAETLLKHSSEYASDSTDELRRSLSENIENARARLKQSGINLQEQGQAAVDAAEQYVHQHPLQALGIAAGVGLVLGLLLGRR